MNKLFDLNLPKGCQQEGESLFEFDNNLWKFNLLKLSRFQKGKPYDLTHFEEPKYNFIENKDNIFSGVSRFNLPVLSSLYRTYKV